MISTKTMDHKRRNDSSKFNVVLYRTIDYIEYVYDWFLAKWLGRSWIDYITETYASTPLLVRKLKRIEPHVRKLFGNCKTTTVLNGRPSELDKVLEEHFEPITVKGIEGLISVYGVIAQKGIIDEWLDKYLNMNPSENVLSFREKLSELCQVVIARNPGADVDYRDLGFQRPDPMTDFRSLGMVSLLMMFHFATEHKELIYIGQAMEELPFALTSMQVAQFVVELYKDDKLDQLLYLWATVDKGNFGKDLPLLARVHNVILRQLFCEFHKSSYSVMEFSPFWAEFSNCVEIELDSLDMESYFMNKMLLYS